MNRHLEQHPASSSGRIVAEYPELRRILTDEFSQDQSIVVASGCFDVLHVGHIRLITEAAAMGDFLVMALNTDAGIKEQKGPRRPYYPLGERMEIIAALGDVDFVTSFPERTPAELIACLQPSVFVKGTDWNPDELPERDVVLSYGGRIAICGDEKSHASTDVVTQLSSR